ncbi:MAG: GTPase Era [Polyangiaceae bacterium]
MRFGSVALVGRSNVGKSTFLNAVLGEPLAIVSSVPQTTRDALLGIVHRADAQIAFLDTPGLHRPRSELGRRMNAAANEAVRGADVILMMTDLPRHVAQPGALLARDEPVFQQLPAAVPAVLAINKVDLWRNKAALLPVLVAYTERHAFTAVVPISVRQNDGVDAVLDALTPLLAEGPAAYESDELTNRPTAFFVREYVREQVLEHTRREVPHAVAVSVDAIEEGRGKMVIRATIHVEKAGQQRIVVGRGGETIKTIGTAARKRIESLTGQKVYLELFVRVSPQWKDVPRQLAELGYDSKPTEGADGSGFGGD